MRPLLVCLAFAFLALATPVRAQAPGSAEFDAGVAAYRSGEFPAALQSFQDAGRLGFDNPRLHFNLGLTYYQLRRLDEARAEFEALRRYPDFAGIADFHLALVAAREGDRGRAEQMWRALERGPDAALAQRAGVALQRLEAEHAGPPATGYLLAGAGYDSNVALLDDSVQPAAGSASPSSEFFGAFSLPLAGTLQASTVLHGGAYRRDYAEDLDADQSGLFAGLSRDTDDGVRRGSWGLDASASELDGESFLRIFGIQALRGPAEGRTGARVNAQLSRIGAADPYVHLEGWRARAGAGYEFDAGRSRARLAYEFEANDRKDLAVGSEFFSYSPLRHRLELAAERPIGARTSLRWNLRYRDSRYRDPDRFQQGAMLRQERRAETLALAGLQLRRAFGRNLHGLIEYQYSRNDATPQVYSYDRSTALVGLEWTPGSR